MQQITNHYSALRIVAVIGDETACSYYRVVNPLKMLQMHGANVVISKNFNLKALETADILFLSRQYHNEVYDWCHRLGFNGKLTFYDIDDNFSKISPKNPAYSGFFPKSQNLRDLHNCLKASSGVITSTPELHNWYSSMNPNCVVIPNFIDFSFRDWSAEVTWNDRQASIKALPIVKRLEWEGVFTVGWSGSTSHAEDVSLVMPAVVKFLQKPNTRLVLNTAVEFASAIIQKFNIPEEKVDILPFSSFQDHPQSLKGVDVWLAPIVGGEFNICKTWLKVMESMAAGSVCIASCVGPYARFHHKHPNCFFLVGDNEHCAPDWGTVLDFLYENKEKLETLKTRGRARMMQYEALEGNFDQYVKAFNTLIDNIKTKNVFDKPISQPTGLWGSYGPNSKCPILGDVKYKKGYKGAFG